MTVDDEKRVKMRKQFQPWLIFSWEEDGMVLRDDAPENIRKIYEKWKNTKPIMPSLC